MTNRILGRAALGFAVAAVLTVGGKIAYVDAQSVGPGGVPGAGGGSSFVCNSANNCAALDTANTFTDLQTLSAGASIPQGESLTLGRFHLTNPASDISHLQLTGDSMSGNLALAPSSAVFNIGSTFGTIKLTTSGFEFTKLSAAGTTYILGGAVTTERLGSLAATNNDLRGHLTLSSGTATYTFLATYTTAPTCVATDTTAANAVQVSATTTTLTLTGTGTDAVNYLCAD